MLEAEFLSLCLLQYLLYSKIPFTSFLTQLRKKLHKVDRWLIVERRKLCVKLCVKLCASKQNEEQFTPNSTWRHSTDLLLLTLSFSKFRVPLSLCGYVPPPRTLCFGQSLCRCHLSPLQVCPGPPSFARHNCTICLSPEADYCCKKGEFHPL